MPRDAFFDPDETFSSEYGDLPEGEYPIVLDLWDYKKTKAGTGHYLELQFLIIEHLMMNRKHWERLNLDNPNETAVNIAREHLNKLLKAFDWKEKIQDDEALFEAMRKLQGKRLNMVIHHRKGEPQVKDYKPYSAPSTGDDIPF